MSVEPASWHVFPRQASRLSYLPSPPLTVFAERYGRDRRPYLSPVDPAIGLQIMFLTAQAGRLCHPFWVLPMFGGTGRWPVLPGRDKNSESIPEDL